MTKPSPPNPGRSAHQGVGGDATHESCQVGDFEAAQAKPKKNACSHHEHFDGSMQWGSCQD